MCILKYRRSMKKQVEELVRQNKIRSKLDDLRKRVTAIYKAEMSFDEENDEEIHALSIPEINNEDVSLKMSSSELTMLSVTSNVSNDNLENENNISDNSCNDINSEHFENENSYTSDGIMYDIINNRCIDSEDNTLIQFENEEQKGFYALETLKEWAIEGGVSMKVLDNLLLRLRVLFPILPKSYKTLLQTPEYLNIQQLSDGSQLWYKGIRANFDNMLLTEYLQIYNSVIIDVNIDGLPLSKSSKLKLWPILGYLVNTKNEPFIICLYFSEHDPADVNCYLHEFVNEVEDLLKNGYVWDGSTYPFIIRNYILDAPAHSLIKRCISHGGYGACEKCTCVGEYVDDRIVYTNLNAPLRTDYSYITQEDPLHHIGRSILERVRTGMVSQFRLDPFHLVWHGVFKRLLMTWMQWNGPWKLNKFSRRNISNNLNFLRHFCPSDFCRLPRSINDWKMYKGTEERRLCLYDGLLVFRDELHENIYKNYLLLQTALYILSSPLHVNVFNNFANELLRTFIQHCISLYGRRFVVHNVHLLCHLAQECTKYGSLENFSSFKFENRLKSIKNSLKSGYKPLQQVALRDLERTRAVKIKLKTEEKIVHLSRRYKNAEKLLSETHFQCLSIDNVVFRTSIKDSCFCTTDGSVYVLKNIIMQGKKVMLICSNFQKIGNFYTYPLPSSRLGIVTVSDINDENFVVPLQNVHAKCWLMPYFNDNSFLCVPLLHTILLFQ